MGTQVTVTDESADTNSTDGEGIKVEVNTDAAAPASEETTTTSETDAATADKESAKPSSEEL